MLGDEGVHSIGAFQQVVPVVGVEVNGLAFASGAAIVVETEAPYTVQ